MRLLRIIPVVFAAVVIGAGLVACGDDDDDTGGDGSPTATESPAAATSPGTSGNDETPPAAGGNVVDVKAENFAFDPAEITVPAGEPVTFRFTNADSVSHTFTLYTDEAFENPIGGGSATVQEPEITVSFIDPGEYYFRCELHPSQMQGELKAQ